MKITQKRNKILVKKYSLTIGNTLVYSNYQQKKIEKTIY